MEVNLDDWYRPEVDRKKLKALSKRRDLPGLIHFFFYFLSLFISGYLAYITLGTWWTYLFFFIYGTIYAFSVANWHETVHRTAFKTRWINEFFYHISSFMCDFEGFRWRWSHTFHHSKTLQTEDDYDHEIQVSRPIELFAFFLNFIPLTDLLYPHKLIKFEVLKHAFGKFTPVIDITAPKEEKKKILWNSRFYSVRINPVLSFLYWHMEYHLEHHMFPMVPSYNLKKLRKEIDKELPQPFTSLYDFYKKVLPAVIALATNQNKYYKVKLNN